MNCPNCGRKFETKRKTVPLRNGQEHLCDICQYCKEIVHFVISPIDSTLYSWAEDREYAYVKLLNPLIKKNHILYITGAVAEENLVEFCRNFAASHSQNVAFILSYEYAKKAEVLNAVYRTAVLPEQLFPEKPSFIAEKLIVENVSGKLYSTDDTIFEFFEKLPQ